MTRTPTRWHSRVQTGSISIELMIVTPMLVAMIFTIVGASRYVDARDDVSVAAFAAARAASLQPDPAGAAVAGQRAARQTLSSRGKACQILTVIVDTTGFRPGGQIDARVTCTANLSDVTGFGLPGSYTVTQTAVVPIDQTRVIR
jgi:Flp pilus assembly protein TadG